MLELSHNVLALAGTLTETATGRDGLLQNGAHGHVDGAEEEMNVLTAVDFDQWHELHQFHAHLILFLVAQQIGHRGLVVPFPGTDLHRNGFALAVLALVGVIVRVLVVQCHAVYEIRFVRNETCAVDQRQQVQKDEKERSDRGGHF